MSTNGLNRTDTDLVCAAMAGEYGAAHQDIAKTVLALGAKLLRKNRDYGASVWRRPVLKPSISVDDAMLARMSDKIQRIVTLLSKDESPQVGESLDETFLDLAGYAILWVCREPNAKCLCGDECDE